VRHTQAGMTGLGWLMVLGLVLFASLITIRLVPIYLEGYRAMAAIDSLDEVPRITTLPVGEVRSLIRKRFYIEGIENVDPDEDVYVNFSDGVLTVELDAEVRGHLVGNLDGVASFYRAIEFIAH